MDSLNFIIQNLNAPPFNCNTSLIAFDLWSPTTLLQQLSDVISWITQTNNVDVMKESADETALRLLHHLKILKFEPPSDVDDLEEWRSGLVEGAKRSIYPVLFYLFTNVDALKQRAYLAKYLVKVGIPEEWRSGLVEGAKRSIYPVLFYLFTNVDALKQRAYLAKYLVKVSIP
ncbi:hypothetical protein OESDEN_08814 [Oesophagostomum dentatum]|uniref:Intraflagellar transport protein 81 homolog n=1 Tax=Oesophagostomum dentatum TaxID=61180 RepID=A0A0B1T7F0_OESDE|nr:hypothetical protein OESDEN_08814 [Oesophagostomum dentatum]